MRLVALLAVWHVRSAPWDVEESFLDECEADPLEHVDATRRAAIHDLNLFLKSSLKWQLGDDDESV